MVLVPQHRVDFGHERGLLDEPVTLRKIRVPVLHIRNPKSLSCTFRSVPLPVSFSNPKALSAAIVWIPPLLFCL